MAPDAWSHDHKEWQETLDLARSYGWTAEGPTSHKVIVLRCPSADPAHTIRVFATGKATESVARTSRNKIRRCPHRNIDAQLAKVQEALNEAQRLVELAEMAAKLASTERAIDQLWRAVDLAEGAQGDLDWVEAELHRLEGEATAAQLALAQSPAEATERSAELTARAESNVRSAELQLRDLPSDHERVIALRSQAQELRRRAEADQPGRIK